MRGMASGLLGFMMLLGSPSWAAPRGEVDRAQEELLPLAVVTCPVGAFRTTFTPPLRDVPQDVRIQGEGGFSNCYIASTDLDACRSPEGLTGMSATQTVVLTRVL